MPECPAMNDGNAEAGLLAAARRGDEAAFEGLVERHRRELQVHCYRMLGSVQDAEDALQESLLAAWRGLATFEGRSSNREISRLNGAIQKVVVSDTLSADEKSPWRSTTRIVRRADARQQIADLKRGPGRDILVFGSRTLWNQLLMDGLVDELQIMVGAVVLGAGTPAFGNGWSGPLRLLDTRRWEGSNNVLLRYACS
jgi:dihydrofolate reductase